MIHSTQLSRKQTASLGTQRTKDEPFQRYLSLFHLPTKGYIFFLPLDLVTSNGAAAKSIAVLGNVEEEKGVAHALARLAEVEDKLGQLHSEQHKEDLFSFSERIKDYIGLLGAVRVNWLFNCDLPYA